jgi:predicted HicB family RNase H-like nuclease
MTINGYQAVITFDPDISMFRGEFVGLNGGADFYAKDIDGLHREGEISLKVFVEMCERDGVPVKKARGKFALRLDQETYQQASIAAAARGKSLNQFIAEAVRDAVAHA